MPAELSCSFAVLHALPCLKRHHQHQPKQQQSLRTCKWKAWPHVPWLETGNTAILGDPTSAVALLLAYAMHAGALPEAGAKPSSSTTTNSSSSHVPVNGRRGHKCPRLLGYHLQGTCFLVGTHQMGCDRCHTYRPQPPMSTLLLRATSLFRL